MRDLQRICVHEAGHFLVAYKFNPSRAVNITIERRRETDPVTGEDYIAEACTITNDLYAQPNVLVSIRAAGLSAECVVYHQRPEQLLSNPTTRAAFQNDIQNAQNDLQKGGLVSGRDDESFWSFWDIGYGNAQSMLQGEQEKLQAIAKYCAANEGREITREELEEEIGLA